MNSPYCFDTSSLIRAAVESYPLDIFPTFWKKFDELAIGGRIISARDVRREIRRKSASLWTWANKFPSIFVNPDEEIQDLAVSILANHQRLLDTKRGKSGADPFVIATAKARRAIVVTQEDFGNATSPKIPFVCKAFRVDCINLLDFIRRERWQI